MYVRLHYGPYQGEIKNIRHNEAVAAVASGRATRMVQVSEPRTPEERGKATFIDGAWLAPIAQPVDESKPATAKKANR